jgi:hypothetical protein
MHLDSRHRFMRAVAFDLALFTRSPSSGSVHLRLPHPAVHSKELCWLGLSSNLSYNFIHHAPWVKGTLLQY